MPSAIKELIADVGVAALGALLRALLAGNVDRAVFHARIVAETVAAKKAIRAARGKAT